MYLYVNNSILLQIDLLKSKKYLLDLVRSLTCNKHNSFNVPELHFITPEERAALERSKVQERMLEKKVKRSIGWEKFSDVFMISAIHNHGSSDIRVSYFNSFAAIINLSNVIYLYVDIVQLSNVLYVLYLYLMIYSENKHPRIKISSYILIIWVCCLFEMKIVK